MKKTKILFFPKKSQKDSGRPLEASEGLGKASRRFFAHGMRRSKYSKKFTEECFAQHVDGAPSTAPSKISAEQRLIIPATVKWSLHQGSDDGLNQDHEIREARNIAVSPLTKSLIKLLRISARPWQKIFYVELCQKINLFMFIEKASGRLGMAPGGIRRALDASLRRELDGRKIWKSSPKSASHNTSMALHRPPKVIYKKKLTANPP